MCMDILIIYRADATGSFIPMLIKKLPRVSGTEAGLHLSVRERSESYAQPQSQAAVQRKQFYSEAGTFE